MKLVLIRPYDYENAANTVEQKIYACGHNTGNIVWYEGVRNSIKYDVERRTSWAQSSEEKYIIPLANHINIRIGALENIDSDLKGSKDIVIIGLGAQLTEEYNTPQKLVKGLPKERIVALRNLSKKCVSIGIRGWITAECLDLMGIHNYTVIGCPSFYSDKQAIYRLCCSNNPYKDESTWSINLSAYGKKQVAYFLNRLNDTGILGRSYFILQHMYDMPRTIEENTPVLQQHIETKYPGLKLSPEEWGGYIRNRGRIFFNYADWRDFIKSNIFLSVGMRFHGNMAALLSGVSAVWITHDSRTEELCEALQLPHLNIDMIKRDFDIGDVMKLSSQYNRLFWNNYCKKMELYKLFLEKNGLELYRK